MSKIFKRTGVITVVVLILVLGMTAMAVADDQPIPMTWYLDSQSHSETGKYQMERTTGTQGSNVTLPSDGELIWLSEYQADAGDVTFNVGGFWSIAIAVPTADCDAGFYTFEIGSYDPDASEESRFQAFAINQQKVILDNFGFILEYQWDDGTEEVDWSVDEGDYLALRITNDTSTNRTIYTAGSSSVTSPDADPSDFVPELTTGILLGVGLLGLGGFIFIKRRRAGKASN